MSAPSAFYRQHHQVEAPRVDTVEFRPAWRRLDRLRGLYDDKHITRYEFACGLMFRVAAEHAIAAGWPPPVWRGLGGGVRRDHGLVITRLDDINTLRRVEGELGRFACDLILAVIINDFTWRRLADCLGVDPRTVRAWAVLAIKALARVFSTTSTKGE
jgi:hypothetical protein